jgi:hypothetical protein
MTRRFLLALVLIVTLSACTFSDPSSSTPGLLKQIEKGEQKWQKHGITGYRVEVMEVRSKPAANRGRKER